MINLNPKHWDIFFIHSLYKPWSSHDAEDVVIVKERHVRKSDGYIFNKLKYYYHPERRYWITKPELRMSHTEKKETELMANVDEYISQERYLSYDIQRNLNIDTYKDDNHIKYVSIRELCNSPYVYGADIPIEILVKHKYKEQEPKIALQYTFGTFDIESSVFEDQRINVFTTTIGRTIRTSVLKDFLSKNYKDNLGKLQKHIIHRLKDSAILKLSEDYTEEDKYNKDIWEWDCKICSDEYEMIQYNLKHIHDLKPDFMGGWNARFDIQTILSRLRLLQNKKRFVGRIEDVMCHPDVPLEARYCKYIQDNKKVDHFILNWDWFHCSGYTQYIDMMRLYGYLRKAKGLEPSYALNAILQKELNLGKLGFGDAADHATMQKQYFEDYIAYNIFDTIPLLWLEEKNHDIDSANALLGDCIFEKFNKTSIRVSTSFYFYCLQHHRVPATVGNNMITPAEKMMTAVGGAVLEPFRIYGSSLNLLQEINTSTLVFGHVSDLDFTAMYPSIIMAFNIAKESKIGTILKINNEKDMNKIEQLICSLVAPQENAVIMGTRLFKLPGYDKMEKLFLQKIKKHSVN
jgi:hypothetical protein